MKQFNSLVRALEYIETHITEELSSADVARYSYVSLSSLQKTFRYSFDYSIKEYISKRRLTIAAKDLVETQNSIIDIALKYGYNSPENFSRAFRKLWNITPFEYRKNNTFTEVFPKIQLEEHDGDYSIYKDITMLYDLLLRYKDCFVICFDVVGLIEINCISRKLGDAVIMEATTRINHIREASMPLFRIGGDEFALIAVEKDASFCKDVEDYIAECNHKPLLFKGNEFPVVLRTWIGKNVLSDSVRETSQNLLFNVKHAWDSKV